MPFPLTEHNALLALKGVGPAVIARLEQLGIDSLARAAINAAIEFAKDSRLSTSGA